MKNVVAILLLSLLVGKSFAIDNSSDWMAQDVQIRQEREIKEMQQRMYDMEYNQQIQEMKKSSENINNDE